MRFLLALIFALGSFCSYGYTQEQNAKNVSSENTTNTTSEEAVQEQKPYLFIGQAIEDNINLRADSTINAEILCKLNRGDQVEVVNKQYDWLKVRLPSQALSFIKKEFLEFSKDSSQEGQAGTKKTARLIKDNVNIRSKPDATSIIIGKAKKNDEVVVLQDKGEWCRIEPIKRSFGLIRSDLLEKVNESKLIAAKKEIKEDNVNRITVIGILKPKTFKRIATHKLLSDDNTTTYLLRGNKEFMDTLNNRRVKFIGNVLNPEAENGILVQVEKIEEVK